MTFILRRETIYEAAYEDEAFSALPELIRRACDARSVILHFVDDAGAHLSMAHTGHWSDDEIALYGSMADKDILALATAEPERINRFWNITGDLVSSARLRNSEIHSRFFKPTGDDTHHVMGASFETPWGVGAIGIHRGQLSTAFGDPQIGVMQDLADDLRRLLVIRSRLALSARSEIRSRAVLDRFNLAIFQVDATGRVQDANLEAQRLVALAGTALVRGGLLEVAEPDGEGLRRAIRLATQPRAPQAGMVRLRAGPLEGWTLTVTPLPAPGAARALVVVKSLSDEQALFRRLQALFGLSLAEAAVAAALSRGEALSDVALARGVTEATVRSQLKALFAKTGCRRQAQLVALVSSLPPVAL